MGEVASATADAEPPMPLRAVPIDLGEPGDGHASLCPSYPLPRSPRVASGGRTRWRPRAGDQDAAGKNWGNSTLSMIHTVPLVVRTAWQLVLD